jgi:hypothetical protein
MFAASTWFAAGQPPLARPGQAGRWAAGRGRPATVVSVISDGDRLACAGRTHALPSARWELLHTCRPGNNALPVCTVTARHGTGDHRGPRQGRSGPHGSRAPHGRPAHRGGMAHGQLVVHWRSSGWTAGRHGSARPAASCVRTVCGHVVSTECGRPPGPAGWRRRGAGAGTPDPMWHLAGACLAVGCGPALPVPDQRRGECDQYKDAQEHHPAGPDRLSVAHQRDHHEQFER